jgi:pyruvate/2-oxoglutarate dehydrogenase complex dihydrolipoamide acyltransferase (E2) component
MPQVPIIMPQLGESIAEATIVDIKIKPGDEVVDDQEIIDVETNKAVMGVTTPCKGKIDKITVQLKETYPVGAVLGYVEASEQDAARFAKHAPPTPPQKEVAEEIPARADQEVCSGARKKDRRARWRRRPGRRSARSGNYKRRNLHVPARPRAHG